MKFTDLFIRRPVLAIVVSLLIVVLGVKSLFSLPVNQYPKTQTRSSLFRPRTTVLMRKQSLALLPNRWNLPSRRPKGSIIYPHQALTGYRLLQQRCV